MAESILSSTFNFNNIYFVLLSSSSSSGCFLRASTPAFSPTSCSSSQRFASRGLTPSCPEFQQVPSVLKDLYFHSKFKKNQTKPLQSAVLLILYSYKHFYIVFPQKQFIKFPKSLFLIIFQKQPFVTVATAVRLHSFESTFEYLIVSGSRGA